MSAPPLPSHLCLCGHAFMRACSAATVALRVMTSTRRVVAPGVQWLSSWSCLSLHLWPLAVLVAVVGCIEVYTRLVAAARDVALYPCALKVASAMGRMLTLKLKFALGSVFTFLGWRAKSGEYLVFTVCVQEMFHAVLSCHGCRAMADAVLRDAELGFSTRRRWS